MTDILIGTSRLNIDTEVKDGWNMSNIKIQEDWLTSNALSFNEDTFQEDVLLDIYLMKHPKTKKNGIFITSSNLEDTQEANKRRESSNEK